MKILRLLLPFLFVATIGAEDYKLPNPLVSSDGTKITTKSAWEAVRRPEILKLFEDHVYGQLPKQYDNIKYVIVNKNSNVMNGNATLKEVQIEVTKNGNSVRINLVLFVPNKVSRPVPVFLLINNRDKSNTDPTRQVKSDFWPAEMVIDNGYAIAAYHYSDTAPDSKDNYKNGVLRLYPEQLTKDNGMKAIGAWAWGASRIMDYFVTDKDIDATKVVVLGHSRGGKASLWCGAQDQRFAITISNDSGCGGAALSKRIAGQTVANINNSFPHWFCNNFRKYNNNEEALPVDQHMLIALMAPRLVYVASASKDSWADPLGELLSVKHSEPVFGLYGLDPLPISQLPKPNTAFTQTDLGYHLRDGEHDLTSYDWANFIKFAQYHYGKSPTPSVDSYTIQLKKNWNLVSFPLQPSNTDVASVLAGINGSYTAIYSWNGTSYESYYPDSSSNTLTKLIAGRGYWVFMEEPASIQIKGSQPPKSIELKRNWNLVGFNSIMPMTVEKALSLTGDTVEAIYAYDSSNNKYETVETLEPGRGYWIIATRDVTWTLP
jgi:hypothetical protein